MRGSNFSDGWMNTANRNELSCFEDMDMPGPTLKTSSDILKSLNNFLLGPEEDVTLLPSEQVQGYLKSEGIDPALLVNQVRQRIAKLKAERELAEAREKRLKFANNVRPATVADSSPILKEKIRKMLELLKPSNPELAAVYFRKFEESAEDDLESLLDDLTLLENMEEEDAAKRSR